MGIWGTGAGRDFFPRRVRLLCFIRNSITGTALSGISLPIQLAAAEIRCGNVGKHVA